MREEIYSDNGGAKNHLSYPTKFSNVGLTNETASEIVLSNKGERLLFILLQG